MLTLAIAVVAVALGTPVESRAATLHFVSGKLVGASGVDVGGTLYEVEFLTGSCAAVFNGCDSQSDFTFTDLADATLAQTALLTQVLFVSPANVFGLECHPLVGCISERVLTPYLSQVPASSTVLTTVVQFSPLFGWHPLPPLQFPIDEDDPGRRVNAAWSLTSPPAVPSLNPLGIAMLCGLLGLVAWRRLPGRADGVAGAGEPMEAAKVLPRA